MSWYHSQHSQVSSQPSRSSTWYCNTCKVQVPTLYSWCGWCNRPRGAPQHKMDPSQSDIEWYKAKQKRQRSRSTRQLPPPPPPPITAEETEIAEVTSQMKTWQRVISQNSRPRDAASAALLKEANSRVDALKYRLQDMRPLPEQLKQSEQDVTRKYDKYAKLEQQYKDLKQQALDLRTKLSTAREAHSLALTKYKEVEAKVAQSATRHGYQDPAAQVTGAQVAALVQVADEDLDIATAQQVRATFQILDEALKRRGVTPAPVRSPPKTPQRSRQHFVPQHLVLSPVHSIRGSPYRRQHQDVTDTDMDAPIFDLPAPPPFAAPRPSSLLGTPDRHKYQRTSDRTRRSDVTGSDSDYYRSGRSRSTERRHKKADSWAKIRISLRIRVVSFSPGGLHRRVRQLLLRRKRRRFFARVGLPQGLLSKRSFRQYEHCKCLRF